MSARSIPILITVAMLTGAAQAATTNLFTDTFDDSATTPANDPNGTPNTSVSGRYASSGSANYSLVVDNDNGTVGTVSESGGQLSISGLSADTVMLASLQNFATAADVQNSGVLTVKLTDINPGASDWLNLNIMSSVPANSDGGIINITQPYTQLGALFIYNNTAQRYIQGSNIYIDNWSNDDITVALTNITGFGTTSGSFDYDILSGAVSLDSGSVSNVDLTASGGLYVGIEGRNATYTLSALEITTEDVPDGDAPVISTLSPTNGTSGVALDFTLAASFSENIVTNTQGSVVITNTTDNELVESIAIGNTSRITVSDNTLTIDLTDDLDTNTFYAVLIDTNALMDTSGNFFAGIRNPTTWAFDTVRLTVIQTVYNTLGTDWNDAIWGSGPSIPISYNDYQTASGLVLRTVDSGNSTFAGGSLEVIDGSIMLTKNKNSTATVSGAFTLSGGTILAGPSGSGDHTVTLAVDSFTVSGTSDIQLQENSGNMTITKDLTGSGHLYLSSNPSQNGSSDDDLIFAGISAFTGAITLGTNSLGAASTYSGDLTLDLGTSDFTFWDTFTIVGTSVLQVNNGQTLTFLDGGLVDPVNGAVGSGTYTDVATELGANYTGAGTIEVKGPPGTVLIIR